MCQSVNEILKSTVLLTFGDGFVRLTKHLCNTQNTLTFPLNITLITLNTVTTCYMSKEQCKTHEDVKSKTNYDHYEEIFMC